jgi:hypothetical protein
MEDWRETSRYDRAERRKSIRAGRQKGVTVFIPAAELRRAGIDPDGLPPEYKLTGSLSRKSSHRVIVSLYPIANLALDTST